MEISIEKEQRLAKRSQNKRPAPSRSRLLRMLRVNYELETIWPDEAKLK